MNKLRTVFTLLVLTSITPAFASDGVTEIDVRAAEFLDVIETADGSIWKGVVVEQTPNVQYKIATADGSMHVIKAADVVKLTKERNRDRAERTAHGSTSTGDSDYRGDGVSERYDSGSSLPPPVAHDGARIEPELAFVFPNGLYDDVGVETSFAPGIRIGYESMFGNFGLSAGGHARFVYWRLPDAAEGDATWLLETQLYGRAAFHLGRATPYVGMSLGLDTNYYYDNDSRMSDTAMGFGMNLMSGLQISATPTNTIDIGFDYHPGTDTIPGTSGESAEYYAMRLGTTFRM